MSRSVEPVHRVALAMGIASVAAVLVIGSLGLMGMASIQAEPRPSQTQESTMTEPARSPGDTQPPATRTQRADKQLDIAYEPKWIAHMGCLIACSRYLKNDASKAWIYGGCGHAFALNIHEQLCPSGPTAWSTEKCDALAANVGLKVESYESWKGQAEFAEARERIWQQTRQAIDAGFPCFGWELSEPEWFVVCGYDEDGNYLFEEDSEQGVQTRKKHYTQLGDSEIGVACIRAVKPCTSADDRTVVREAIRFALAHGAGGDSHEVRHTGLTGYDTWIAALEEPSGLEGKDASFGLAYNSACWAECRRYAVRFLEEAKTRLADEELAPLFEEALMHYRTVSTNLDAVAELFPFTVGDSQAMAERARDPERRAKALEALRRARAAEAAGLKALAKVAVALGAQDINPDQVGTDAWLKPASPPG